VTDPRTDYNALVESSYVNIPVIGICNSDNNLTYVDCAIPCNNRAKKSLAMIYWLLTKEVLKLQGKINGDEFDCLPGAFMFRGDKEKTDERKAKKRSNDEQQQQQVNQEEAQQGEEAAQGGEEEDEPADEEFI
jgi:small subunit ribosomal protein SAe